MILYRYEDGWLSDSPPILLTYTVSRETAKCYVIDYYGITRFILKNPEGRRFAYASLDDAKNSYRIRKQRQIQRCHAAIRNAEAMLAMLDPETHK